MKYAIPKSRASGVRLERSIGRYDEFLVNKIK